MYLHYLTSLSPHSIHLPLFTLLTAVDSRLTGRNWSEVLSLALPQKSLMSFSFQDLLFHAID